MLTFKQAQYIASALLLKLVPQGEDDWQAMPDSEESNYQDSRCMSTIEEAVESFLYANNLIDEETGEVSDDAPVWLLRYLEQAGKKASKQERSTE